MFLKKSLFPGGDAPAGKERSVKKGSFLFFIAKPPCNPRKKVYSDLFFQFSFLQQGDLMMNEKLFRK